MEPVELVVGSLALSVLKKAGEKVLETVGEKIGETLVEKSGQLLELLKLKAANIATNIEKLLQVPLAFDQTVIDVKAVVVEDSEVKQVADQVVELVQASPELQKILEQLIQTLKTEASNSQQFTTTFNNHIGKVVNLAQGHAKIEIKEQTITL